MSIKTLPTLVILSLLTLSVKGFDGIGLYQPDNAMFILDINSDLTENDQSNAFQDNNLIPITGDWDGDGIDSIGSYSPSQARFYLDFNGNGIWDGPSTDKMISFGGLNHLPVIGDWNGDGKDNIGIYRPSTAWFILDINGNYVWDGVLVDRIRGFGPLNQIPIAGDWNGNGFDTIGIYRPAKAWFVLDVDGDYSWSSNSGDKMIAFGAFEQTPLTGDWDGDGKDNIGLYSSENSRFILDVNDDGKWSGSDIDKVFTYGDQPSNIPLAGVWNSEDPVVLNKPWEPSLVASCDVNSNASPILEKASAALTQAGQRIFEPSIIFSDQTTTLYQKSDSETTTIVSDLLQYGGFKIANEENNFLLYDDGTHGDVKANDGVYTRSCVYLPEEILAEQNFVAFSNIWVLNHSLRRTELTTVVSSTVRKNNSGFFIKLGDVYHQRFTNNWSLLNPAVCEACKIAWDLSGDVFDFFVLSTRDPAAGAGYVRVHDNIKGTGFNPPCENNSYCYDIVDGNEHQKLNGLLWIGWPGIGDINHELGHGFLGIETRGFPGLNEQAWNSGDLFHLDSDITVTGELSGPFWDPVRGWPHSVLLEDEHGMRSEVYLTEENGNFKLASINDNLNRIWDDILLYMMGLMEVDEVTKTYYKLLNPSTVNCTTEPQHLICTDNSIIADEFVSFTVSDLVSQYGDRTIPDFFDPENIQLGVLHISDRAHTDAEIVWLTKVYRDFAESQQPTGNWATGTTWSWATKNLSKIHIITELQ